MVAPFVTDLQRILSSDRLDRYRAPGGSDLEMAANYFWNVELCETLYQTLGALEMALRNSLGQALAVIFGQPDWYDAPDFLLQREAVDVLNAKFKVKASGKPVTPGRIVAFQTFGFWTSLLDRGYSKIWTTNNNANLALAFPNAPATVLYRKVIFNRMNAIRLFRNRIFHYESILDGVKLQDGSRIPLVRLHDDILEAIGWTNQTFETAIRAFDRFPAVHAAGSPAIETRIRTHLGI